MIILWKGNRQMREKLQLRQMQTDVLNIGGGTAVKLYKPNNPGFSRIYRNFTLYINSAKAFIHIFAVHSEK